MSAVNLRPGERHVACSWVFESPGGATWRDGCTDWWIDRQGRLPSLSDHPGSDQLSAATCVGSCNAGRGSNCLLTYCEGRAGRHHGDGSVPVTSCVADQRSALVLLTLPTPTLSSGHIRLMRLRSKSSFLFVNAIWRFSYSPVYLLTFRPFLASETHGKWNKLGVES